MPVKGGEGTGSSACIHVHHFPSFPTRTPTLPAATAMMAMEQVIKDRASVKTLTLLALQLKRGTLSGPEAIANATARALRSVVSAAKFASLDELILIIRTAGRYLQQAQVRGECCKAFLFSRFMRLTHCHTHRADHRKYHPPHTSPSS